MHQDADLLAQKRVGTLQFFVTQQQALNALGDLVDLCLGRHGKRDCRVWRNRQRRIRFVGARGVVHTPQFNGKQEEVTASRTG